MITDKIDEYLNRKKKPKTCLKEQTDINSAILELLNGLDDEYLDDRQIELKEIILSANPVEDDIVDDIIVPENDLDNDGISDDFGDDGFADEFATDDEYDEENKPKLPSTTAIGNKDLYGYDENDLDVAEGQKKIKARKSFMAEEKTKKIKKVAKKTK